MNKYLKEYKWSNIRQMLRNNKIPPKECNEDFPEKLVVISGATSGIGYSTARKYAAHRANLLLINRNEEKSINLCEEIHRDFGVKCDYITANYLHVSDVRNVAQKLIDSDKKIDVLIHNAGIFSTTKTFTEDNIETVFQVNYLSSFILNYMLKEKLKSQGNARILFVNSEGYRFAISGIDVNDLRWEKHRYSGNKSYGEAKTAQLLSMIKFNDYFENSGTTINAMHPGNVKSNIGENNGKLYRFYKHKFVNRSLKSPEISASALYYLGVSKEIEGSSGRFFNLTTEEEPAPHALDREVAEELWKNSIELGGL